MPGYIGVDTTTGAIVKRYFGPADTFESEPNIMYVKVPRWYNIHVVEYDVVTQTFSDPKIDDAWRYLRNERSRLLVVSDWTQLNDIPTETQQMWAVYRQALRDLPANVENPMDEENIPWPAQPSS